MTDALCRLVKAHVRLSATGIVCPPALLRWRSDVQAAHWNKRETLASHMAILPTSRWGSATNDGKSAYGVCTHYPPDHSVNWYHLLPLFPWVNLWISLSRCPRGATPHQRLYPMDLRSLDTMLPKVVVLLLHTMIFGIANDNFTYWRSYIRTNLQWPISVAQSCMSMSLSSCKKLFTDSSRGLRPSFSRSPSWELIS